jgi:glycosyltransferase involved in cell wall biosynthesis
VKEPLLAWQADVFWTALRARLPRELPDVVLVEHDWAAGWWLDLPAGVPAALTLHNLSWEYYEARARSSGHPLMRLEARRFRRHDERYLDRYDLLIAMSEEDRAAVREMSGTRTEVVENGVDTSTFTPGPAPGGPPLFLYTGTMSYPPNAEGLIWLLRDAWPEIRRRVPDARLRVVGRGAPEEAQRLAGPEVELTGWVESMAPHFAAATAVLVPILSGGGTRLKVLDAMASGRAIVSTRAGRAGIDVDLLEADDPVEFAAAAARLAADPALRDRLAAGARERAVEVYDWATLGDRLERHLREISGA